MLCYDFHMALLNIEFLIVAIEHIVLDRIPNLFH